VGADLPLVARRAELTLLTGAIEAIRRGQGDAVLLTGEAGVGNRVLIETQREAERRGRAGSVITMCWLRWPIPPPCSQRL
jgi:predicted ATPase